MLINNIAKIIDSILSQNKLVPETETDQFFSIPKNHLKRFFVTPCRTEENKKVLFKVLINDHPDEKEPAKNEIKLYQYLFGQGFKTFRVPLIFDNGEAPAIWYVREFIEYGTISDAHFILLEFLPEIEKYSKIAVAALIEMATFQPHGKSNIISRPENYYSKKIAQTDEYVSKYFPDFKKSATDNFGSILANTQDDQILVHGDYHLENLFFEAEGLVIVDWEKVHIGNVVEDFSHLWLSLWQVPEIQTKILTAFYESLSESQKASFDKNINSKLLVRAAQEFQHWIYCKHTHRNPRYTIETVNTGFDYFQKIIKELLDGSFKLMR